MIIQLSGIDCSGKSTLANKLVKGCDAKIVKYSVPKENEDYLVRAYEQLDKYSGTELYIQDRGPYGCYMYQDVIRQKQIPLAEIIRYAREFNKRGNLLFWVDAPLSEIKKRLRERGDEHISEADLSLVYKRYKQIFRIFANSNINFYKINPS